jgi:hypothetical protein
MRRLLKIYGFQRIAASLIGGGLMWLAVQILGSTPPEYWNEWPPNASLALSNLVSGTLAASFCGWTYLVLKSVMSRDNWAGRISRIVFGCVLLGGIGGFWQSIVGGFYLAIGETGCMAPVFAEWRRVVGWPLLIGSIPMLLLEVYQRLVVLSFLRRWLLGGYGHAATWIRPVELRRVVRPLARSKSDCAGYMEEY